MESETSNNYKNIFFSVSALLLFMLLAVNPTSWFILGLGFISGLIAPAFGLYFIVLIAVFSGDSPSAPHWFSLYMMVIGILGHLIGVSLLIYWLYSVFKKKK